GIARMVPDRKEARASSANVVLAQQGKAREILGPTDVRWHHANLIHPGAVERVLRISVVEQVPQPRSLQVGQLTSRIPLRLFKRLEVQAPVLAVTTLVPMKRYIRDQ